MSAVINDHELTTEELVELPLDELLEECRRARRRLERATENSRRARRE